MTLNEIKLLTFFGWNESHQPLTIEMTKLKFNDRCRLGLDSRLAPDTNL